MRLQFQMFGHVHFLPPPRSHEAKAVAAAAESSKKVVTQEQEHEKFQIISDQQLVASISRILFKRNFTLLYSLSSFQPFINSEVNAKKFVEIMKKLDWPKKQLSCKLHSKAE